MSDTYSSLSPPPPSFHPQLLSVISVCVAGYRPPQDEQQGHDASVDGLFEDEAGLMWRNLAAEVLVRKVPV